MSNLWHSGGLLRLALTGQLGSSGGAGGDRHIHPARLRGRHVDWVGQLFGEGGEGRRRPSLTGTALRIVGHVLCRGIVLRGVVVNGILVDVAVHILVDWYR